MPHWPIPHKITPTRVDLSNMTRLMQALDNPHLKLPPVIHVAGTNGKGSTVAYLKAIFESAGYKTHTYTSPHLVEFNERIVLAGEKIFDDHLFQLCERVRMATRHPGLDPGSSSLTNIISRSIDLSTLSHKRSCLTGSRVGARDDEFVALDNERLDPTFFEATTAAAFSAFAEIPADILLIETGLGGRLDATNIVPNPLLTIITPISYDHMPMLGPTLPIIAAEKAGIIKPGVSCVISAQVEDVMDVFLNRCNELGSESIAYGYDFAVDKESGCMIIESASGREEYPLPGLLGDHQLLNASAVIMACGLLQERFNITYAHICDGLQKVEWPGRLQRLALKSSFIWLDGAHNTGAAQVLALWISENLSKPVSLILGMTKNRDALAFASFFKNIVSRIYCVRVYSEPSSYTSVKLAELVAPSGIEVISCESLDEAIDEAVASSNEVVVTGSLFLVADALKIIR